ncbi:MAG: FecR domain-containing protein [Bacteroidota bacterium]
MRVNSELIRKYHLGQCTPEESAAVEKWLNSTEEEEQKLTGQELEEMSSNAWKGVSSMLEQEARASTRLHKHITRYATAAIILFTVGFFSYRTLSDNFGTTGTEQSIVLKTINTQRGEKRSMTLSDGSTIRMNYETEIQIPEKFEGNERVVYLTGHAHFDVVRDTERPFIIYTEDTKTQVLGTSFDINTKEKGVTEVIVTSGEVAFSEKDQADNLVMLTVNDRAVLRDDKSIATDKVNAARLTGWKDNRLIFDGQTFREIINVLEPWYDVEISVENADLLDDTYKFAKERPSLERVLMQLSFAGRFEYRIEGKSVSIF